MQDILYSHITNNNLKSPTLIAAACVHKRSEKAHTCRAELPDFSICERKNNSEILSSNYYSCRTQLLRKNMLRSGVNYAN